MNRSLISIALGLLLCALLAGGAQARIWYVPSQVPTVPQALDMAGPGDEIAVAVGTHRITGDGHRIPAGVTIRTDTGMPGGVIFEEHPDYWGDWRDEPVFVVNSILGPSAEVRIEGITFRDFTNTFGPNQFVGAPIIGVAHGKLVMEDCVFKNYNGTAVKFAGGSGTIERCSFLQGRGQPAAVQFAGKQLDLNDCVYRELTQRFPGDAVQGGSRPAPGSILKLISGETNFDCGTFEDNGPVTYLIDVGLNAQLIACQTCIGTNHATWQGHVAGYAKLTCCAVTPTSWDVEEGGTFILVDNGGPAAKSRDTSLSHIRSLFE